MDPKENVCVISVHKCDIIDYFQNIIFVSLTQTVKSNDC